MDFKRFFGLFSALLLVAFVAGCSGGGGGEEGPIKVGVLHSLSGTMANSESPVHEAELMAIEEINENGGVLGRQIEPVVEDGASDWPTYAEKTRKLLQQDDVATIFGCWTSASRKAVKPVVENLNGLLWYPVQYEGYEDSDNIMYMGAAPNQQIVPAVKYLLEQGHEDFYLIGSDYVFPRTANQVIQAQLGAEGANAVAEEYTPLGHTDYSSVISDIKSEDPDVVFNTLNGSSNVAFFKQLDSAGIEASDLPVMSVSIAEQSVQGIGPDLMEGHLVAWNYFMSLDTPENEEFVSNFQDEYGSDRVTTDPMEAAYDGVYLWKKAVEKAGTTDVEEVREAAKGLEFEAPEGTVRLDGDNQHLYKRARVGEIQPDGQIEKLWASDEILKPDPYLENYSWGSEVSTGS